MEKLSDQELISEYFKGDESALEVLIQRYLKSVYNFLFRYVGNTKEAEDIAQEAFIKAWKNLKKFDKNKNFKTWIFSIAKNSAIDFLRKNKTLAFSEFENEEGENILEETLSSASLLPDEILSQKNIKEALAKLIKNLSSKYRIVFFLRYEDHLNFREIAEVLGEPIHTIKSRHRRALAMLQKILPDPEVFEYEINLKSKMHQNISSARINIDEQELRKAF